jgi:hypothetical protein
MNMLQEILKARSDFRLQGLEPTKLYLTSEARIKLLSTPDVRYALTYVNVGRDEQIFGMKICKSEHFCWLGFD